MNRTLKIIAIVLLVFILLIPRLLDLDQFVAIDEVNWLHRSANFYSALMRKDFAATNVAATPGVITTWIESLAFRIHQPNYKINVPSQTSSYYMFEQVLKGLGTKPLEILYLSRIFTVFFLGVVLLACFYYASQLFGFWPSYIGFMLLSLDPFYTALSRTSHLDAPQAVLMFLSLLAGIYYLHQNRKIWHLVLSGFAGGLAFLEKVPGFFILLIMLTIALLYYAFQLREQKGSLRIQVAGFSKFLWVWVGVFILTYFAVWPSLWVNTGATINRITSTIFSIGSNPITPNETEFGSPQDLDAALDSEAVYAFVLKAFRYPITYLHRATPVNLLGLLLFITLLFMPANRLLPKEKRIYWLWFLIFILAYTVGMSIPQKSSEKYFITIHIVLNFMAGVGLYAFASFLKARFKLKSAHLLLPLLAILIQFGFSFAEHPYYITYLNPLFGSYKQQTEDAFYGIGEGLDLAGRYLNQKENAVNLTVAAWYGEGPLSYYFDGKTYSISGYWSEEAEAMLRSTDYIVVYSNQRYRNWPSELFDLLESVEPEHTVLIKNVEYAWIYKTTEIPFAP